MEYFSEVKLFQVRLDRIDDFEALIRSVADGQKRQTGCQAVHYVKRSFTLDGKIGDSPRALTKLVKCVKYFSYWEFDTMENYGKANTWFFREWEKKLQKLLLMPFDINCGPSLY